MKQFLQKILQEIMKNIILGTSDAWSLRHSSQWLSDPAYYIEDCRILVKTQQVLPHFSLAINLGTLFCLYKTFKHNFKPCGNRDKERNSALCPFSFTIFFLFENNICSSSPSSIYSWLIKLPFLLHSGFKLWVAYLS